MKPKFSSKSFIMDSGERYCHMIDANSGEPVFHPNLYVTTQIRNNSLSFSTVSAAVSNLVIFMRFLSRRNIDLEERIRTRRFFAEHELDALRDFTQLRFKRVSRIKLPADSMFTLEELEESEGTVENGTQYSRLTTIALYFEWLVGSVLINPSFEDTEMVKRIVEQIKTRRPKKKGRNETDAVKSLNDDELDKLFEVLKLDSEFNPFTEEVRRRNRLMILLMYHLGIRRGELLNLRISDIDMNSNQLSIVRRPDDRFDSRVYEPNVKTLERTHPIKDSLVEEIQQYIVVDRRKVKIARRHAFLFVTHKKGPTYGNPISISGYNKVIGLVREVAPLLYRFTGHKLRHSWNDMFSERMDNMDIPYTEEKQEQIRSYLMGWSPGSGTAATYNKRFIKKEAGKASLAMQSNIGVRQPKGISDEE